MARSRARARARAPQSPPLLGLAGETAAVAGGNIVDDASSSESSLATVATVARGQRLLFYTKEGNIIYKENLGELYTYKIASLGFFFFLKGSVCIGNTYVGSNFTLLLKLLSLFFSSPLLHVLSLSLSLIPGAGVSAHFPR